MGCFLAAARPKQGLPHSQNIRQQSPCWILSKTYLCHLLQRGVRVVEGARLESVYMPKVYRGFESLPLCQNTVPKCSKTCQT